MNQKIYSKVAAIIQVTTMTILKSITDCDGVCCSGTGVPLINPETIKFLNKQNEQRRHRRRVFQDQFKVRFTDYHWLTICLQLFCFYCRRAGERQLISLSRNAELTCTKDGFQNQRKEHEKFNVHNEAIYNYLNKDQESVQQQDNKQIKAEQEQRRSALMCHISILIYLLRQGLPNSWAY